MRTVMNQNLDEPNTMGPALVESYARGGFGLRLNGSSGAAFSDGGRVLHSHRTNGSLSNALERLHARRNTNSSAEEQGTPKPRSRGIMALSTNDQRYYAGESSEVATQGQRRVRGLGEAQSYGSLHWI